MIPLRRALIVQQHGLLKYPEGTACAEVLKAGASRRVARRGIGRGRAPRTRGRAGAQRAHHLHRLRPRSRSTRRRWSRSSAGRTSPEKIFGAAVQGRLAVVRDLARAAGRGLHHRPADRLDHVRRRRARLPGADPADQVLRRARDRACSRPARSRSPRWARTRSAAPTCSTSAPARWRRAASSACRARCPRSVHGLREGLRGRRRASRGAARGAPHRARPVR